MKKSQGFHIVFFGTPEFAKIILERLINSPYKPILVVTAPDMPAGGRQELTPPPVKVLAGQYKVPVAQPKNLSSLRENPLLTKPARRIGGEGVGGGQQIDLIIVAAYGRILAKEILDLPKYGALNIHPSLLPKYRGPSPIQYAILNGDKEAGVTIIKMDEEIDHGSIVSSIKYQASSSETAETLMVKLAELGANLLLATIPKWIAGEITPQEQVHQDATYTKIITKEDGHITWGKSSMEIERQIRAFTPWPGSYFFWKDKKIEVILGSTLESPAPKELLPGQTFLHSGEKLAVQTGYGIFAIEELQIAGKNKTTIKEFLNGYAEIIGATLI